jgi:hypothetical protein
MPQKVSGNGTPLYLEVSYPVPSFKNSKRAILDRNTGQMRTLTPGKTRQRMEQIMDGIASQLLSAFQPEDGKTLTGSQLRSLIASSVPEDDCWTAIPQLTIMGQLDQANPGVTIIIERIL